MPYTFNGKGEFVLVRSNSPKVKLDVQGRFEQVHDSPYGEVKASMLTAVAAKDNVSATVEVRSFSVVGSSKIVTSFSNSETEYHILKNTEKLRLRIYFRRHEFTLSKK